MELFGSWFGFGTPSRSIGVVAAWHWPDAIFEERDGPHDDETHGLSALNHMLYERISNDLKPEQAAIRIVRRSMELAAAAVAAGTVGSWHVLSLTFPSLGARAAVIATLLGLFLVGVLLVFRWSPPRSRVDAIARALPREGRRRLSLTAVGGIGILCLFFVWYAVPVFFVGLAPPAVSAAAVAPDDPPSSWRRYVSQQGEFSADLPGVATETGGTIPSPVGDLLVRSFTASTRDGSLAFIGQWFDAPLGFADVQKAYDGALGGELALQGATLIDSQRVSWLGGSALKARLRTNNKTSIIVRYIVKGKRLYAAKVVFPTGTFIDDDADRFYSSWRLAN